MNFDLNILQILAMMRAHYKAALWTVLAISLAGTAVFFLLPKQYTAVSSIVFDTKAADPIAGIAISQPSQQSYTATQVDVVNSPRVALKIVAELNMTGSPSARAQWMDDTGGKGRLEAWLAESLRKNVKVASFRDNNIITIAYTAEDPVFAQAVANAWAQAYIEENIQLKTNPARQLSRWFGDQGAQARANLEKAQARLSEFLQKNGIVSPDERFDSENSRLNELNAQFTTLQGQTIDLQNKKKLADGTLPDVMQNSVIAGLRSDIAKKEGSLGETAKKLGKNHPAYQAIEAELAALREQEQIETKRVTAGYGTATSVGKGREAELKTAIDAQKKKVLEIKTLRDQLAVLQRDVDGAQSSYASIGKRFDTSNLESQLTQSNVAILSSADLPVEPSFPVPLKYFPVVILAAIAVGFGLAFLLELLDRRVRRIDDLNEIMELPVLAVIKFPRPRKKGRLISWWHRKALAAA